MTKIGVQLHPQHCTIDDLRRAWREADSMGVDSIWTWDHFFPLYGPPGSGQGVDPAGDHFAVPNGDHFEGYALLAAMACDTSNATIGLLVGCNSYRNPELVADAIRTIDHLSGGRTYLGIGSGWFEKDYAEYGYDYMTAGRRLEDLSTALPRIKDRLAKLQPSPVGKLPILIGGSGEKKTLRYTAQYADAWNTFGPPEHFAAKNKVLTEWCEKLDRDPAEIERTVNISAGEIGQIDEFVEAGASHIILGLGTPFDLSPVQKMLDSVKS